MHRHSLPHTIEIPAEIAVYRARQTLGDPLAPQIEDHIITGLRKFDMGRTMAAGFSERLHSALQIVRAQPFVGAWREFRLSSIDLTEHQSEIVSVYHCLANAGTLHPEKQSHVAATKILHWLFSDLFLMLDSNVATMFRSSFGVQFSKSTQPGYSSERYIQCLVSRSRTLGLSARSVSGTWRNRRQRLASSTKLLGLPGRNSHM
jgi:hypothetical protein